MFTKVKATYRVSLSTNWLLSLAISSCYTRAQENGSNKGSSSCRYMNYTSTSNILELSHNTTSMLCLLLMHFYLLNITLKPTYKNNNNKSAVGQQQCQATSFFHWSICFRYIAIILSCLSVSKTCLSPCNSQTERLMANLSTYSESVRFN